MNRLSLQLNKVIDENSSLRNSLAQSPPATSVSPPATDQTEEGRGEGGGEGIILLYAQVDKSKVTSCILFNSCSFHDALGAILFEVVTADVVVVVVYMLVCEHV